MKSRWAKSGRQDSNLRPPGPKPGAIPGYATPRSYYRFFVINLISAITTTFSRQFPSPIFQLTRRTASAVARLTQPLSILSALLPKQKPANDGGEGGIRTLDTSLSSYNGLANRPFRPLRHLSEPFFREGKNREKYCQL